jgi:protocatechuate 3,4-dioxygenase beta subunit
VYYQQRRREEGIMREFTEESLTEAVIERIAGTPDARLKEVMTSFIRHLHAFVRETRPTPREWAAGIEFLTRTGQMCDAKRQEFILVSDTLGVSMLVDFLNYGKHANATESTVTGPFFVQGAPEVPVGGSIARPGTPGRPALVTGSVRNAQGKPVPGATLDIWQSGDDGFYDVQKSEGVNLRGKIRPDAKGEFWFRTVVPKEYPVPTDGPVGRMLKATGRHPMRPGHLHFIINAPGYRELVTHLFTSGDEYLDSDAVFGVKESLIVDYEKVASKEQAAKYAIESPFWRVDYDFVLVPEK